MSTVVDAISVCAFRSLESGRITGNPLSDGQRRPGALDIEMGS